MIHLTSCVPFQLPRFYTCKPILQLEKTLDLPRSYINFYCMPCSKTPEALSFPTYIYGKDNVAFLKCESICILSSNLTRLNHFSFHLWPTIFLSTLNPKCITTLGPRLDTQCARQHF